MTRRLAALTVLMVAPVALARGQSSCVAVVPTATRWPVPLDRMVEVPRTGAVREALQQAARVADVHFTYSVDLLPQGRATCGTGGAVRLGDALAAWLEGSTLEPLVAAENRVVLVPGRRTAVRSSDVRPDSLASAAFLAPVVVQGTATNPSVVPASVAQTVITSERIAASGASSIGQLLSVSVPGLWIWTPSPSSLGTAMASLRGASSFGASYPKVYIDGIEVANPLFLSQLSPDQVARIEVIRGPQGAALYGSGAVGGVIAITTRPASGEGPHMSVRSTAGVAESAFAPLGSFVQEHAFSGRIGGEGRSASLGALTATTGAFVPGAYSRQLQATAGASVLGARTRWQLTLRGVAQQAGTPMSPLLPSTSFTDIPAAGRAAPVGGSTAMAASEPAWDSTRAQSVREYTVGSTLTMERARWSHELVAGVDGYRLDNVAITTSPLRTPGDSALLAAAGAADRLSMRWNGSTYFTLPGQASGTFTMGVEQSSLRDATRGTAFAPAPGGASPLWRHTTGAMAHGQLSLRDRLVVNGGMRLERNAGYTILSGVAALPTVGVVYRRDGRAGGLTLRAAWGKAIQPPRVGSRANPWGGRSPSILALEPEAQAGFEFGADLRLGGSLMVSLTRFDQRASNLIQPVVAQAPNGRGHSFRLENLGAIDNTGWELETRVSRGSLSVTGALGLTESVVSRLAAGYRGDLRAGDRVLQVPAHTASLGASWLGRGWTSSMTVARAGNWINYDWMGLASAERTPQGAELRQYWLRYPGVTRLGATFTREVSSAFELIASGENLLGQQRGEPDNLTVVPGRTLRAGIRARF